MRRLVAVSALLAACSGGQQDVDNVEATSEPLPSSVVSAEPTAAVTSEPTAAPTSTGRDASGKIGKICTQIGCRDQLQLQAPNVKLAPGTYLLSLDVDGKGASCPLEINAKKEMSTHGCVGDPVVKLAFPGDVPVRGAEGGFSLVFASAPTTVKVKLVSSAKKVLSEQTFTPTYKTVQPNGPDCSPSCKQGEETLELK